MEITRKERTRIVKLIDENSNYDAKTIRIHADGRITATVDPDKAPGCDCWTRRHIAYARDFANGRNPFDDPRFDLVPVR